MSAQEQSESTADIGGNIRSYRDKDLADYVEGRSTRAPDCLPPDIRRSAMRRLAVLDAISSLRELDKIGGGSYQCKKLRRRRGFYSIRVNEKYRIIFRWEDGADGGAFEVQISNHYDDIGL